MTSRRDPARWRSEGVRIIRPQEFDSNVAQTPGLHRLAAVTTENSGATQLWAGTFTVDAKAETGPHHHGDLETVIYVLNGVARLRWGARLEFEAEAAAGDFIYVPPYVPHQEINPSPDLQLQCVLARSGQKGLVFNLEIEGVETPELHRSAGHVRNNDGECVHKRTSWISRLEDRRYLGQ